MMLRPLTLPLRKVRMLRRCSSRTILTATSLDLAAADDGGKAGHAAVHQLDAPGAQLDVVDRAVQVAVQPLPRAVPGW
jgi:RecA-family ATPase